MSKNPFVGLLAIALAGIVLFIALALTFIYLTDPTRETVSTSPPENEVRQTRAPEPATSTAPGAPRDSTPPPVFSTDTEEPDTGNTP
ncbi:hypothetical protein PHACT_04080 [Pseudohongiella acticola]|jgi:hypothetical protein|uniref:Uncharacterized protein n=1 Tax=Pseudohongiella acticola TaxID=1524254 RepID=A0A1E8CJ23_9GAMM|nr:hypothetical protein [Pseudohongiella acticola]OFE12414.1 hypothetical protein PHACT_04080 [Pseudohongiella acticola]